MGNLSKLMYLNSSPELIEKLHKNSIYKEFIAITIPSFLLYGTLSQYKSKQ